MKSHSLTPVAYCFGEPPLSAFIAPTVVMGLMLSMIWIAFNERHKRRIRRRF